jgi:DNA-binding transcriptional ArsR family regulator
VNAFDVLGDPVRRRILEFLAGGARSSGEVVDAIAAEFGISQPAVSQHLKVLRESGFATVRPDGTRRVYSIDLGGIEEVDRWLSNLRGCWERRLDALGTEIARASGTAGGTPRASRFRTTTGARFRLVADPDVGVVGDQ